MSCWRPKYINAHQLKTVRGSWNEPSALFSVLILAFSALLLNQRVPKKCKRTHWPPEISPKWVKSGKKYVYAHWRRPWLIPKMSPRGSICFFQCTGRPPSPPPWMHPVIRNPLPHWHQVISTHLYHPVPSTWHWESTDIQCFAPNSTMYTWYNESPVHQVISTQLTLATLCTRSNVIATKTEENHWGQMRIYGHSFI